MGYVHKNFGFSIMFCERGRGFYSDLGSNCFLICCFFAQTTNYDTYPQPEGMID